MGWDEILVGVILFIIFIFYIQKWRFGVDEMRSNIGGSKTCLVVSQSLFCFYGNMCIIWTFGNWCNSVTEEINWLSIVQWCVELFVNVITCHYMSLSYVYSPLKSDSLWQWRTEVYHQQTLWICTLNLSQKKRICFVTFINLSSVHDVKRKPTLL